MIYCYFLCNSAPEPPLNSLYTPSLPTYEISSIEEINQFLDWPSFLHFTHHHRNQIPWWFHKAFFLEPLKPKISTIKYPDNLFWAPWIYATQTSPLGLPLLLCEGMTAVSARCWVGTLKQSKENKAPFEVQFPTENLRKGKRGSVGLIWREETMLLVFSPAILDALLPVSTPLSSAWQ